MPGARAPKLNEQELINVIHRVVAVLAGAAYHLYDQAIAIAIEKSINAPGRRRFEDATFMAEWFHEKQKELPHGKVAIDTDWVKWACETYGNWRWLTYRYIELAESYETRFGTEAPLKAVFRDLYRRSPRPRTPGRTPFPEGFC